jgi:chemotaxis methyl-accepting protein methylase
MKKQKAQLTESIDMTKAELKNFIKDVFSSEIKKMDDEILSKEDVKKIVKDMMVKQYKFFWEKKSFWTNSL